MLDGDLVESSSAYLVHCFLCYLIYFSLIYSVLCKSVFSFITLYHASSVSK
uniref:Uncharacterized protein n=1 Tax=Aegilops tauschii subsp. strangulata TaxID=200361 RepID=A0A453RZ28_AEGTS